MLAQLTRVTVRLLDGLAARTLAPVDRSEHHQTGRRGEEDAYFFLRKFGYVIGARNYRSPRRRGEIDLIDWDDEVLCFIEVKTRSSHHVKPAEVAVDQDKQRELQGVGREYLRRLPSNLQWRFDVVSVYYENPSASARIELFENAFPVA
jgi:putative endonuclease